MPQLIDAEQLSQFLGVKEGTIYDWVRRGKIPHVRLERLIRFESRTRLTPGSKREKLLPVENLSKSLLRQAISSPILN